MKVSELNKMLMEDLKVDKTNLAEASLATPTLHAKWMQFSTEEGYKLAILEQRMAKLRKAKWEYYSGKAPAIQYQKKPFNLKLTKGELPMYIDADDDIQELERKIEEQSLLVNRLSEAVKSIQFRHTNIKNAVEWTKLQNGIMG